MEKQKSLKDFLSELETGPTETEKMAEALAQEIPANVEVEKTAEDADLEGLVNIIDDRINSAFEKFAELQKEAVGVVGATPDPQAVPENPGVQLSRELGPEQQATNSQVAQLIAQLTNGERMAGPNGYIAGPAGIMAPATAQGQEPPVAGEEQMIAQAMDYSKAAAVAVVEEVYSRFFGETE